MLHCLCKRYKSSFCLDAFIQPFMFFFVFGGGLTFYKDKCLPKKIHTLTFFQMIYMRLYFCGQCSWDQLLKTKDLCLKTVCKVLKIENIFRKLNNIFLCMVIKPPGDDVGFSQHCTKWTQSDGLRQKKNKESCARSHFFLGFKQSHLFFLFTKTPFFCIGFNFYSSSKCYVLLCCTLALHISQV